MNSESDIFRVRKASFTKAWSPKSEEALSPSILIYLSRNPLHGYLLTWGGVALSRLSWMPQVVVSIFGPISYTSYLDVNGAYSYVYISFWYRGISILLLRDVSTKDPRLCWRQDRRKNVGLAKDKWQEKQIIPHHRSITAVLYIVLKNGFLHQTCSRLTLGKYLTRL